jgi:hypothetical protein
VQRPRCSSHTSDMMSYVEIDVIQYTPRHREHFRLSTHSAMMKSFLMTPDKNSSHQEIDPVGDRAEVLCKGLDARKVRQIHGQRLHRHRSGWRWGGGKGQSMPEQRLGCGIVCR